MKTTRTLRLLSLLGFLLLLAPFYDSCNGNYIHKVNADGTEIKVDKSLKTKIYDIVVNEEAFNAFQIASFSVFVVRDSTYSEFKKDTAKLFQKKDWYKDLSTFFCFFFDFFILLSFSMFALSFTKKIKFLNKLALVNSILILITFLYVILLESSFEHFRQIKWGYYAFIITNLLIFYYSKLALKPQKS
jgi:hypothetical protein